MTEKRILCAGRRRRVPKQFSWVDHRLVRDGHIRGRSHEALSLYLFLVTVSDADGLSYYSDAAVSEHLGMESGELCAARRELRDAGLIAYRRPLYQVLSLEDPLEERFSRRERGGGAVSIADVLAGIASAGGER